ncbi:MAG: DUF2066 domain-containing protein [Alphaproteobacteria bacterium]|nr:DUF2066 domain-containing protein [Alphaproteobacteria bacterium]
MKALRTLFTSPFSVKALACLLLFALPAQAQDTSPFTVRGVEVKAQGTSPLKAKETAVAEGQLEALRRLGKARGVPEDVLASLTAEQAANAASGYQVMSESTGRGSYQAVLAVTFDPAALQRIFGGGAVAMPQTPTLPGKLVLLPLMRSGTTWLLWEDTNLWKAALSESFAAQAPLETMLPTGTMEEVALIDGEAAATADKLKLEALKTAMKADRVIIAEAERVGENLSVRVYSVPDMTDLLTPQEFPGEYALQEGASHVLSGIGQLKTPVSLPWQATVTTSLPENATPSGEPMRVLALINGTETLPSLRARLRGIPGIAQVQVEAVTPGQADLLITLSEPVEAVQNLLAAQGMSLEAQEGGYWILRGGS